MTPDGHLRNFATTEERLVLPYLYLGRQADARLAYLCELVAS
jgi:hypothetical protein